MGFGGEVCFLGMPAPPCNARPLSFRDAGAHEMHGRSLSWSFAEHGPSRRDAGLPEMHGPSLLGTSGGENSGGTMSYEQIGGDARIYVEIRRVSRRYEEIWGYTRT